MEIKPNEIGVRLSNKARESFDRWMAKPETKFMISLVPQTDNPDTLATLLASCYMNGNQAGQGEVAVMMIERILDKKPRD